MAKITRFLKEPSDTKSFNKSGIGLGLTISKLLIQQLGGMLSVDSKPFKGCRASFFITLHHDEQQPHVMDNYV